MMPTRAASGRNCGVLARCSRLSSSRSISLTITWYLIASGAIRSASRSMFTAAASFRCCV
jgi:hypothetical protein